MLPDPDETSDAVGDVSPEPTAETPSEDAESASGAEDAPGAAGNVDAEERFAEARRIADANPPDEEEIVQTAPIFEAELVIGSVGVWVQRTPGGGRQLKFVALRRTPAGAAATLPAYVMEFDAAGYAKFLEIIERDGEPRPQIVRATQLPPGVVI